jgi:hypothetical protein
MYQEATRGIDSAWWHFDFGDRARVRRDVERVP